MNFCEEIQNICYELDKCQIQNCERLHPKSFSGVCIGYLQNICQQSEFCGLHHFSLEDLEAKFDNNQPINGIYKHNLCYKKCNDFNCRYLHPPWLKYICVDCENKKCDKIKEGLWHIAKWVDIRKKVYEMYNVNKLNPEKFCSEEDCQCDAQKYNFDIYCIKYFKGICPHHRCQKPHKNWEDIKDIGQFQNLQDQVIKPCIKYDETKNKYVSQLQTLKCALFMNKNSLQLMISQIQQRPQADIIFILDCTKSMDIWIEKSKKSISSIIAEFKKKVQINTAVRMAAVCYKDFSDPNHIQYHNFTVRPEEIEKFLGNIKIEGGDDIPEDLQGALDVAYKLKICKDPASLLQIFILTDAPCHGRKYHNFAYDQKPDAQDLEEKLQKFVDLKQRFFLSFLQIKKQTQKMEQVIKNIVPNYQSAKVADKQFSDYILFSLASTYNKSMSMNVNKEYEHVCSANYTKQKEMPYKYNNRQNENYYDFILSQINNTQKQGQTLVFIENQELQVNQQGQQQEVFKGFDQKNNVHIIIKIQKSIIKKYNSKTLTADDIDEANKIAQTKYQQQLIAKQLSHHFNFCCKIQDIKFTPLYYATPYLYELEKPFKGVKLIYAESYIDIDQPWKKYTNNSEYRDESIDLTAFSHFTYQYTNCQMIITDLQGKTNILSDPAIHTSKQNLTDSTNLIDAGCRSFFLNQHPECQTICKQLNLKPTEIQQKCLNSSDQQSSNEHTQLEDPYFGSKINGDNRFKICSNCNALEKLEQESDTYELCDSCKKESQNKETVNCQCCNAIFEISMNFQQIFGTVIQYCQECQNKQCHLKQEKKCYYCSKRICLQTIKEIVINGQRIEICADAHYFLRQVKCKDCYSNYNFKQLLSQDEYYKNEYHCGCKNK